MENKPIKDFKDLRIWQKGIEIVKETYRLTAKFPNSEQYNLSAQLRRSAVSIPSNVAEGFKRYHNNEYKQFLYISLGSSAELETQLIIAQMQNYIEFSEMAKVTEKLNHFSRMTTALIQKL